MIAWSTAGTKGQLEAAYGLHLCNDCLVYYRHQRATGSGIWLASVEQFPGAASEKHRDVYIRIFKKVGSR